MDYEQSGFGMVHVLLTLIIVSVVGFVGWFVSLDSNKKSANDINSFEACVAAGNPIAESYPEQCTANGKTFVNPNQVAPEPAPQ